MTDYVTRLNEHRDELQARITELENALREYGDHRPLCDAVGPEGSTGDPCTCGWEAARKVLDNNKNKGDSDGTR